VPRGQSSVALFAIAAMMAMLVLAYVGRWYATQIPALMAARASGATSRTSTRAAVCCSRSSF
jgi:FSR family fosmidomycin resistance protein-like MFS transporter